VTTEPDAVDVVIDTADTPFAYDHHNTIAVEARTTRGYLTINLLTR